MVKKQCLSPQFCLFCGMYGTKVILIPLIDLWKYALFNIFSYDSVYCSDTRYIFNLSALAVVNALNIRVSLASFISCSIGDIHVTKKFKINRRFSIYNNIIRKLRFACSEVLVVYHRCIPFHLL
jgi:hypothetical protein